MLIIAEANLKSVQFLDVNLDLSHGTSKPFCKPNSQLKYVCNESNHPPMIVKNIPEGVNRRLERISSCKKRFEEEIPIYQKALEEAGYSHTLTYREEVLDIDGQEDGVEKKNRKRRRTIIWFNPPYSANVKTNIGKRFFGIK